MTPNNPRKPTSKAHIIVVPDSTSKKSDKRPEDPFVKHLQSASDQLRDATRSLIDSTVDAESLYRSFGVLTELANRLAEINNLLARKITLAANNDQLTATSDVGVVVETMTTQLFTAKSDVHMLMERYMEAHSASAKLTG